MGHRRDGGVRAQCLPPIKSDLDRQVARVTVWATGQGNLGGSCGDRGWLASEYGHVVIEDLDVAAMAEHGAAGFPPLCL